MKMNMSPMGGSPLAFCLTFFLFLFSCSDDAAEEAVPEVEAPTTAIPDANFEAALVDQGLDDALDGFVKTASIDFITDLNLDNQGIRDLRGIADFRSLVNLSVRDNALSALDLSRNTELLFVWAENNTISSLELGTNADIEKVGLSGNQMQAFDTGPFPRLQLLTLADNEVSALDVSGCPDLNTLAVEGNPLECIQVSAAQLANIPGNWSKDAADAYSESCD